MASTTTKVFAPRARVIGCLVLLLLTSACGDDYDPQVIEETQFAPSLGVNLAEMTLVEGGVYTKDLVVGEGDELVVGMNGTVDFTLWLADGTLISTFQDFSFVTQGEDLPITGFVLGVLGMRVGGERLFLVPPELGYGEHGSDPIPPGAILVFQVTLTEAATG